MSEEHEIDESIVVWTNPYDSDDQYTVGDIVRWSNLENLVRRYLARTEDGIDDNGEFAVQCEELGISPAPCPLCGRYSEHGHDL